MAIPIPDVTLERDRPRTFGLGLYFSDPDGDRLTYTATTSDPLTVGVSVTGSELTLTPLRDGAGTVTVTATDPGGLSASEDFTATVGEGNRHPTAVGNIADQMLTLGGRSLTVDLAPRFSDPDGDQLTFQVTSGGSGVVSALISASGLILVPVAAGTASVTVTATDPGGLSATQTFEVTVGTANRDPVAVGEIPDQSLAVGGSAVTLDVSANFTDPDGDTLTYAATSSDSGVVRAVVSGTEVILIPVGAGMATVTVTATDPGGLSVTQTFEVTAGAANRDPVTVGSLPDQRLTAGGSPVTLDVASSFSDPDGDQLTFQAVSSDSGVVRAVLSGTELILIPVATGTTRVRVTASDPGGLSATQTFQVTVGVANRRPVATGVIPDQTLSLGGSPSDVSVARNFSDPDGDSLTLQATSNDSRVVRVAVSGFELTLIPEGVGVASVRVTATDPGGLSAVQLFHVTVTEPARAPATPTGLHVAEVGADFIEWRWNAVADAIGYEVQFSTSEAFDTSEAVEVDGTSHLVTGLPAGTRAYIRVRAVGGTTDTRLVSGWTIHVAGMTAAAPDDHGDTEGAATTIGVPSTTDGELETAGDVDYFRFQLGSSEVLTVHTTGTIDTVGVLTGPNGLQESNDDAGDGRNFSIMVEDAPPGDYYVAVRGYGSGTGLYELHVTTSLPGFDGINPDQVGDEFGQSSTTGRSFGLTCADDVAFSDAGTVVLPSVDIVALPTEAGTITLEYEAFNIPDRFVVEVDGRVAIDTRYVGSSSHTVSEVNDVLRRYGFQQTTQSRIITPGRGTMTFQKRAGSTSAVVRVYAPLPGTQWQVTLRFTGDSCDSSTGIGSGQVGDEFGRSSTTGRSLGLTCTDDVAFSDAGTVVLPSVDIVALPTEAGTITLEYEAFDIPDRFVVEVDGRIAIDTRYVGSSSHTVSEVNDVLRRYGFRQTTQSRIITPGRGTMTFQKRAGSTSAVVRVYAPLPGTQWQVTLRFTGDSCGSLDRLYGALAYSLEANAPRTHGV